MSRSPTDIAALPPGWNRQLLTVPTTLAHEFRGLSAAEGYGGAKLLGTAATALFCGLPPQVRDALVEWVMVTARKDPQAVRPDEAWKVVAEALRDPDGKSKPGQKSSDQAARKGRRGTG